MSTWETCKMFQGLHHKNCVMADFLCVNITLCFCFREILFFILHYNCIIRMYLSSIMFVSLFNNSFLAAQFIYNEVFFMHSNKSWNSYCELHHVTVNFLQRYQECVQNTGGHFQHLL